jgi:hypothetical protein
MLEPIDYRATALEERGTPYSRRDHQLVLTYRGWDAYERSRGGPNIVDFDLSTIEGAASFGSRQDVLSALEKLHDQLSPVTEEEEFLRARIRGSITYLRVLMGQQIKFQDYLNETLGFEVRPFTDQEVESARSEVSKALAPFGIDMRREDRERFEHQLLIHDPDAIKQGIVGQQDFWLSRLRETGIPVPRQLPLTVEFAEVDAYWNNWISGSARDGITLQINIHPRKRYDRGRPLVLCLHEVCGHAVQMSIWRELIVCGRLSQACGLTTVHAPEMFVAEGLGQTVPELLADVSEFSPEFHLSRALQYFGLIILHNAHLMIYEGVPVDKILQYARDRLPLSDSDALEAEIRDRGTNPLFRSYQLSYSTGEQTIKKLIRGLSVEQKQKLFLAMYTIPMTPAQLLKVGEELRADGP